MTANPINTVILGYGIFRFYLFAPFLDLRPGFNLLGALERYTKKTQKDYPYTLSYNSYRDVLADEQVEFIVVNTPIATHYQHLII